jgi:hypothetical protein
MPILGSEQLQEALRIGTIVLPVTLYFLLLGLLNSRRRPQLLSARQDAALLIVALLPVTFVPLSAMVGGSLWVLAGCLALAAGGVAFLAPVGSAWVVYNLSTEQGERLVRQALEDLAGDVLAVPAGLEAPGLGLRVEIGGFWLLRNVSIRLIGGTGDQARQFEQGLADRLQRIHTDPHPMAVALLLVATVMLVAPLTLLVHQVPEIVRLLGDLLG